MVAMLIPCSDTHKDEAQLGLWPIATAYIGRGNPLQVVDGVHERRAVDAVNLRDATKSLTSTTGRGIAAAPEL